MRGVITDMAATDPVVNGRGVLLSCASPEKRHAGLFRGPVFRLDVQCPCGGTVQEAAVANIPVSSVPITLPKPQPPKR